ncbi:MAG: hypothetical protein K1X88_15470 [Nannocystaceae bacterium]|nr:hypothetical protein [Nannocystaceae bacterium]
MLFAAKLDEIAGQSRRALRLQGPDARRFLSGCISGDLGALAPDQAVVAALLTIKGKLVSELVVLLADDGGAEAFDVWIPADVFDEVARALDEHLVMDDVALVPQPQARAAVVWDDEGEAVVLPAPVRVVQTRHPLPAQLAVADAAVLDAALADASVMDAADFHRARIESGTPGWGAELRPGFFPPEVGFVYAVSYDKGCYLGQEPLARLHARGQVHRVLVRVVLEHPCATPLPLRAPDRDDAGTLTTCVAEIAGAGGLAIVRRELASLSTLLHTATEPPVPLRVVSTPLGDDAGVGGRNRS